MTTEMERRKGTRIRLTASVSLAIGEEVHVANTDLEDLSLDGIRLKTTASLPPQAMCTLEITLKGPSSLLQFSAKGRILRNDAAGTAVKFTELDFDSYLHLKNVVLYNRSPDL